MNLSEIKKQLPHGAIKEIAQRSGLSTTTVSQIFNGIIESPKLSEVLKATAEYLKEYKAKENEAVNALNEVLNPETVEQFAARMNYQAEKYGKGSSPLN